MSVSKMKHDKNYQSRLICAVIFIVALAPVILAIVAYRAHWFVGSGTVNNGQLISPTLHVQSMSIQNNQWAVWFVYPQSCQQQCLQVIDKLDRLYQIMGKERPRLTLALSLLNHEKFNSKTPIKNWDVDQKALNKNYQQAGLQLGSAGDIFLVDPHGNIFMHYPADASLKSIHDDLKRVLKLSRIG